MCTVVCKHKIEYQKKYQLSTMCTNLVQRKDMLACTYYACKVPGIDKEQDMHWKSIK